jgi:hypothetical protein
MRTREVLFPQGRTDEYPPKFVAGMSQNSFCVHAEGYGIVTQSGSSLVPTSLRFDFLSFTPTASVRAPAIP